MVQSARELKKTRSLTTLALLVALTVIVDFFTFQPFQYLHLSFEFVPKAAIGMLFGPVPGMLAGAASDLISFALNPKGAYFPGYTLTAIVSGLIYGLALYRKPLTWPRIAVAKAATTLVCSVGLNNLWTFMLMGPGFWGLLPARLIKAAVALPCEIVILMVVLKLIQTIRVRQRAHA